MNIIVDIRMYNQSIILNEAKDKNSCMKGPYMPNITNPTDNNITESSFLFENKFLLKSDL